MSQVENMKSFTAGGSIGRAKVVYASSDFTVKELDGTARSVAPSGTPIPVGVAQHYGNKAPGTPFEVSTGLAASSGDHLMVYADGADDAYAQCGGTIAAGDSLGIDSTALIISAPASTVSFRWLLGYAKEAGTAGDVIRIRIGIAPRILI